MTSTDDLARLRTKLANERTLLAYVRTGLAIAAAGASLITFFDSLASQLLGWSLCIIGVLALLIGLVRFRRVDRLF